MVFMVRNMAFVAAAVMISLLPWDAGAQSPQEPKKEIRYETPSLASLSRLYWAISKMDINNDVHVDNFMLINECGLYKDFYHNELEWGGIRDAAREHIKGSVGSFSTHLEYLQLIHLGDYDSANQSFEIYQEDKILGGRSFEILARDIDDNVCSKQMNVIEGYPKGLYIELNRPVVLDRIVVPRAAAEKYIEEKLKIFNSIAPVSQTKKKLYETREAYLVMRVNIIAYDQDTSIKSGGREVNLAKVYAILDGYSVYSDKEKRNLLFSETYGTERKISPEDEKRRQRYQERLRKYGIIGAAAPSQAAAQKTVGKQGQGNGNP